MDRASGLVRLFGGYEVEVVVAWVARLEAARRLFREEIGLLIGRLEAEACDEAAAKFFARAAGNRGDVGGYVMWPALSGPR